MARKLYRSEKQKVIGGVCGGIAEYFNVDPVIIRLLWLFLFFFGGFGFLSYIIAWIIIPSEYNMEKPREENTQHETIIIPKNSKKLSRSKNDKILGGVCAGFAKYLGVDASIVRILFFLALFFAGLGVWIYIASWLIIPEEE